MIIFLIRSKEIKEQKLDRSTVMRFQLCGKPQMYAIQRVELISHYVFKNLQAEIVNMDPQCIHSLQLNLSL